MPSARALRHTSGGWQTSRHSSTGRKPYEGSGTNMTQVKYKLENDSTVRVMTEDEARQRSTALIRPRWRSLW